MKNQTKTPTQLEMPLNGIRKNTVRKKTKKRYIEFCKRIDSHFQKNAFITTKQFDSIIKELRITNSMNSYMIRKNIIFVIRRGVYRYNLEYLNKPELVGKIIYEFARENNYIHNSKKAKFISKPSPTPVPLPLPSEKTIEQIGGKHMHTEFMIKQLRKRGYVVFKNPFK